MNQYFHEIKKKFGFGCMRLPEQNGKIDREKFSEMIDLFIAEGFNYFDTAHAYHSGDSEQALRECLVNRYPRESFILTDKLSSDFFNSEQEIRPFFESQLEICGVDYFDFYLMHAQTADLYKKYTDCHAYEVCAQLKKEGKIKHFGISFHDTADVLDTILTQHPEIELVQIQFNYIDYADSGIQSKDCYEVCRKHNKPVVVMEPVKGGILTNLIEPAKKIIDELGGTPASYAIRFAASFEGVAMVLSGMSNMDQLRENLAFMKNFSPLNEKETGAIERITQIMQKQNVIPCTACRYCTDGCPKKIPIPDLFACLNEKRIYNSWHGDWYYAAHTKNAGKASDCIECGKCEKACPQHLNIRQLLKQVAETFDHKTKGDQL